MSGDKAGSGGGVRHGKRWGVVGVRQDQMCGASMVGGKASPEVIGAGMVGDKARPEVIGVGMVGG